MGMGPVLIFDKSTLQSLNTDEAVWLDNFYLCNITPLFFIETLADIEKSVHRGRTPEQVVGDLAHKTPDYGSCVNAAHMYLLEGELSAGANVDMRYGRPVLVPGRRVVLGEETGVIFEQSPESEALRRWQRKEFVEIERLTAKQWRRALSNLDWEEIYNTSKGYFAHREKPKTLEAVKQFVDEILDTWDQEQVFRVGLPLVGLPPGLQAFAFTRWKAAGRPNIRQFAPYFRHVLSVDLFFHLGIAADLISRDRPSNKIDLAYLYYLPFCMVFTSNDKLHARSVPLFLRPDQLFVAGKDLKADLERLDRRYSVLPEEIKNLGTIKFAAYPPTDGDFLVSNHWDKYLSTWRDSALAPPRPIANEAEKALVAKINSFTDNAMTADPSADFDSDSANSMVVKTMTAIRKGKWKRFPPEIDTKHYGGGGSG